MPNRLGRTSHGLDLSLSRTPDPGARIEHVLADAEARLADGDISDMDSVVVALDETRRSLTHEHWRELIHRIVAPHPARPRLHEEPLTRRAFEKPRGYAGDAAMIDIIYQEGPGPGPLTPLGARLHEWAGGHTGIRSVRERRRLLASLIDRVANERPYARILSLACGHLREAQHSEAVRQRAVGEIVGIDQDPESLALVEREQRAYNVTPIHSSVRRFLVDPTAHGTFDFVYSAGLYDYLAEPVAISLTRAMFEALRPGGTLLVANFATDLPEIGYMEAIMDWHLIYRDEAEVERFALGIPLSQIAEQRIERDSIGKVIYLTIEKR